jgi:hypothetical protein
MVELVHGLGDVVGDLDVAVNDVVLKLQVLKSEH